MELAGKVIAKQQNYLTKDVAYKQYPSTSVRVEKVEMLLGELVEVATGKYNMEMNDEQAQDTLGRHGLKALSITV